jgi:transcriptional regulator with XRE-family HTH domain
MANQYLIHARTAKLWTPEEASERVGVTKRTYLRWEAGNHIPTMTTLKLLCIAFGENTDKPVKPEFLGYIVGKDHVRLISTKDESLFINGAEKATGKLALAYEEMVESLHRSLTLGREVGEKEASEIDKLMRVVHSLLTPSLDMAAVGVGMWLCDRVNKLKAIGTCGLQITVQQYLTIAYAEIESWKRLIDEDYQQKDA